MSDRLSNWSNSIHGNKRPTLKCAKCNLQDSTRIGTWPNIVCIVHQWLTKCCYLWLCLHVRRWHNRLLHRGHCRQHCHFFKQSFIGIEQLVPRELFNPSLGKVWSYAVDEETAHQATKFGDNWGGSDRVGETLSSFGWYYWLETSMDPPP